MPNLKDIERRIDSVKNTKQITSAMKMVATAKLKRAEERVESSRPYANKLRRVIASMASRTDQDDHRLLGDVESHDEIYIIAISSNRGLCGSFNSNLFRKVRDFCEVQAVSDAKIRVATVGDKAEGYFERNDYDIDKMYTEVIGDITYDKAKGIAQEAIELYLDGSPDAVYLAYNSFVSAIEYHQNVDQLLPLSMEDFTGSDGEEDEALGLDQGAAANEYIFEPDQEGLLDYTLPHNVEMQVFQALLESAAAEQGARMTAMDNATENAEEMIEDLTLEYNRARQAAITEEISEIVGGMEAMKD
jgi:F-type H+-transporting ATPase subunit gamma